MKFHVVTLFPEVVEAYTNASILGRAQKNKLLSVKAYQLRDSVTNKWGKADERPYGGGPGMVLQAEPFINAVEKIRKGKKIKVLITAAGGKPFTNEYAKKLAKQKEVIILCGRYEGIDARVKKILNAEEVSVGPYILTGGEIPALTIIDATARQVKGVLGKFESLEEGRVASHDVYTRPEVLIHKKKSYRVPKVLLSGHHANIDAQRTKRRSGKSS
ncbi:tRNA (guanosine(37)-N1)-methyltransferase TrmD [Patescibacteria group bacterium]|nr:tRNA (guanosine(37)-N1)-methyltransferase TrmD [Patescibacteria group bacterium]